MHLALFLKDNIWADLIQRSGAGVLSTQAQSVAWSKRDCGAVTRSVCSK